MLHEASRSYEAAIKVGGAFQLEEKSTVQKESSQNNVHTFLAPKYTDEGESDNGLDKKEIKAIATVVQVAHANQAVVLHEQGLLLDAIQAYRMLLKQDPMSSQIMNNLGAAYIAAGFHEEVKDNSCSIICSYSFSLR